jgi:hypothetical protein
MLVCWKLLKIFLLYLILRQGGSLSEQSIRHMLCALQSKPEIWDYVVIAFAASTAVQIYQLTEIRVSSEE